MRYFFEKEKKNLVKKVANYIIEKINFCEKENFVLGLPTGGSPIPVYSHIIDACNKKKVSFKNVITFNMDEYLGLEKTHSQSYYYFMQKYLFDFIDIPQKNINFLDGVTKDKIKHCQEYEDKINQYGGIDLFFGGLGTNGHIAFNEPFSSLTSKTREKQLTMETIENNARFFAVDENQPNSALTVGIQTVMNAKEIIILALGKTKAQAVKQTILGNITHTCPSSILQTHPKFILACDEEASQLIPDKNIRYFKHIAKMED